MQNFEGEKEIKSRSGSEEGLTQFSEQDTEQKVDAILGYIEGVQSGVFARSMYSAVDGQRHVVIKDGNGKVLYDAPIDEYAKYLEVFSHNLNAKLVQGMNEEGGN